jgi:dienelactone hydrolase
MREKVTLKINGDILNSVLFFPDKKAQYKALIFLNGSGGTKERFFSIAQSFNQKGYVSFCFDFRGRGKSQTSEIPPLVFQLEDAKKAIKYVSRLPFVDSNKIILVATSMGGYVAASVVNYHKGISQIILIAPAIYSSEEEKRRYTQTKLVGLKKGDITKSRAIKEISQFRGELFIVFLGKDKTIPDWMTQAYFDNASLTKKRKKLKLKDAEHAILRPESGREKVRELLEKILT